MDARFWFWFWLVFLLGTAITSESTTVTPESTTVTSDRGIPTQATTGLTTPPPPTTPTSTTPPTILPTNPNTTTPDPPSTAPTSTTPPTILPTTPNTTTPDLPTTTPTSTTPPTTLPTTPNTTTPDPPPTTTPSTTPPTILPTTNNTTTDLPTTTPTSTTPPTILPTTPDPTTTSPPLPTSDPPKTTPTTPIITPPIILPTTPNTTTPDPPPTTLTTTTLPATPDPTTTTPPPAILTTTPNTTTPDPPPTTLTTTTLPATPNTTPPDPPTTSTTTRTILPTTSNTTTPDPPPPPITPTTLPTTQNLPTTAPPSTTLPSTPGPPPTTTTPITLPTTQNLPTTAPPSTTLPSTPGPPPPPITPTTLPTTQNLPTTAPPSTTLPSTPGPPPPTTTPITLPTTQNLPTTPNPTTQNLPTTAPPSTTLPTTPDPPTSPPPPTPAPPATTSTTPTIVSTTPNTTTPDPLTTTPTTTTHRTTLPSTPNTTTPDPPTTTTPRTTLPITPNTTTPDPLTTTRTTTTPHTTFPTIPYTTTPDPLTTTTTKTTTTTTTTIATTTPTTPPSTTPLVCANGGLVLNGVCICGDEWTGETCSVENFCRAQELDGFRFPQTPVGWFAYSEVVCPAGTSAAGKPEASTRCLSNNGSPSFDHPQVLQCDQTLSDIQQNLTSAADLETLAASTQILTSRPEELTSEDVTAAAQIANTLLLSPNATESVRVSAVATVSQLLNASVPDNTTVDNTTLSLTVTLDQLSVNLSLSQNSSQSQVVQPNLVVQSAQIPAADTQGVQFTSFTGTSGSFVADRIQLNTNTSEVVMENGFIADALIYVRFPPDVSGRQSPSNVSLGFVLYQNDRFFQSRLYMRRHATVRVLSASVHGQDRNVMPQHVEMMFRPTLPNGSTLYDFSCVFWSFSLQDWSTAGCSKGDISDGVLRCFCNHTTNFAALWSFREDYKYAAALDVISIVGLSFSILGLAVTIIHHIREKFRRKSGEQNLLNSELALLCICCSLLAFIVTFLSGVQNSSRPVVYDKTNEVLQSDQHVEPDRGPCTAVAALLHFFLLATFTWNSLYGTQLVLLVRSMRRSLPPYWTPLSMTVGWGVPVVVMAITLAATYRVDHPLGYRQEEFCWLAALDRNKQFSFGKPMFWGFILPVGLILVYNTILLVLASMTTCRVDRNLTSTNPLTLTRRVLVSFSLAVMFGLSWTLGYLVLVTTGHAHLVFSIIFCVCTTTQGFQIFILFTARTPAFRASVQRSVHYVSSISFPLRYKTYELWKEELKMSSTDTYKDIKDSDTL